MKKSKPNQLCIEGADPQTRLESLTGRRYKTDTANGLTNAIIEAVKRFRGFASRINCGALKNHCPMNISHDTAQVLSLLRDGKARSTRQLTFETHSADPRSCIRNH